MNSHIQPGTPSLGPLFDWPKDHRRLERQMDRIRDLMIDGQWRTLGQIEDILGYPQASISAQLRHLKKVEFGAHDLAKRRRNDGGLWEYRLSEPRCTCGEKDIQ